MNAALQAESDLVRDLQAKLPSAFSTLYDAYSPALLGTLLRLIKDQARAEDLLQDAFIKIWSTIPSYDPQQGRLFTWLLAITKNVALDELRKQKVRHSANEYLDKNSNQSCDLPVSEGMLHQSILTNLAPKYRQIVELVYYGEYTKQEVAAQLCLPLGTVKTRYRMALQLLKQQFRQDIRHYHVIA
ncbi:sigma-70 family RNA polymerase sigma factor [Spirosoma sp. HMF4905]|uniref:RNA polymerase sigma factor n=1 Tax=Spirosoma arboris TaxID=2682092 RepID=A0A7K1SQX0_9BACT|nr:sigma-70 family RNA polymerase sigma factor [Spirosoma arboris]MVM36198.1 sigma-70 family RNA polymerase sigma factor [Spirosoma arboris]